MVFVKSKLFVGSSLSAFLAIVCAVNEAKAEVTAESNHAFVGVQAGTALLRQRRESSMSATYNYSYNYTTAAYGILGGYEMWFMDSLGARFYGAFGGANYYMLTFGAGADVIWNFVNIAGGNMGVFAGLYVGANYWLSSWYSSWANANSSIAFDMALDIGLRWAIENHVIEVLGKIPFLEAKTATRTWSDGDVWSYYSKESFSLLVRYAYRF